MTILPPSPFSPIIDEEQKQKAKEGCTKALTRNSNNNKSLTLPNYEREQQQQRRVNKRFARPRRKFNKIKKLLNATKSDATESEYFGHYFLCYVLQCQTCLILYDVAYATNYVRGREEKNFPKA